MDKYRILSINTEASATVIGVYENGQKILREEIKHDTYVLKQFASYSLQEPVRTKAVLELLEKRAVDPRTLSCIAARGGPLPYLDGGAYSINEELTALLSSGNVPDHPTNAAVPVAAQISRQFHVKAMIYDAISTNELAPYAKLTGLIEVERESMGHALNMKAAAREAAERIGLAYETATVIVAYMRSGNVVSLHQNGRMADVLPDDEGPFSAERAGRIPTHALLKLCKQKGNEAVAEMLKGSGGLMSLLGTKDMDEVLSRISSGDEKAKLACQAMAVQIAKGIGEMAAVVSGNVHGIVLLGPLAAYPVLTDEIKKRVEFIAPVSITTAEDEIKALAEGCYRVMSGKETLKEFKIGGVL